MLRGLKRVEILGFLIVYAVTAPSLRAERAKVQATYTKTELTSTPPLGPLGRVLKGGVAAADSNGRNRNSTRTIAVHYSVVTVGDVEYLLSCACSDLAAGQEYDFKIDKKAILTSLDGKKTFKLDIVSSKVNKPTDESR
jgi:hypothetical protein